MYTQCPNCNHPHAINVADLRASLGTIDCSECSTTYNVLELLEDGSIPASLKSVTSASMTEFIPTKIKPSSKYWGISSLFLLTFFFFQIYFFEAYTISQNASIRPWLIKLCTKIPNCQLPEYKNINEITILNGSFQPVNNHYIFKTAIINQASFAQQRPLIKLTLLDFSGRSFATRTFFPANYSKQTNLLEPNIADEITLSIATPSSKIGGYHFELI